jgi:hypothetical protein
MICLDAIELTRHFTMSLSSAESLDTEWLDVGGSTSMHLSVVFAWDDDMVPLEIKSHSGNAL